MSVDPMKLVQTMAGSFVLGQALPVSETYAERTSMLFGVLLVMFAEDMDKIVERLSEENEAIRAIFRDAPETIHDRELIARLGTAAATGGSLRVSVLQAANDRLRAAFIELHAAIEEEKGAPAVALEARIFAELKASAERRCLLAQPL
ncbi:MAG: hypothetical protein VCC00_08385 [Deltaproteobacteria bacterium]